MNGVEWMALLFGPSDILHRVGAFNLYTFLYFDHAIPDKIYFILCLPSSLLSIVSNFVCPRTLACNGMFKYNYLYMLIYIYIYIVMLELHSFM